MMATETSLKWEVVRGFGDFIDSPKECIDVQVLKRRFATAEEAAAFAETHYDSRVEKLMRRMPEWWQSFFVTVRQATN
jgi:hypothetical protein